MKRQPIKFLNENIIKDTSSVNNPNTDGNSILSELRSYLTKGIGVSYNEFFRLHPYENSIFELSAGQVNFISKNEDRGYVIESHYSLTKNDVWQEERRYFKDVVYCTVESIIQRAIAKVDIYKTDNWNLRKLNHALAANRKALKKIVDDFKESEYNLYFVFLYPLIKNLLDSLKADAKTDEFETFTIGQIYEIGIKLKPIALPLPQIQIKKAMFFNALVKDKFLDSNERDLFFSHLSIGFGPNGGKIKWLETTNLLHYFSKGLADRNLIIRSEDFVEAATASFVNKFGYQYKNIGSSKQPKNKDKEKREKLESILQLFAPKK